MSVRWERATRGRIAPTPTAPSIAAVVRRLTLAMGEVAALVRLVLGASSPFPLLTVLLTSQPLAILLTAQQEANVKTMLVAFHSAVVARILSRSTECFVKTQRATFVRTLLARTLTSLLAMARNSL